jgi:hypothetical protein
MTMPARKRSQRPSAPNVIKITERRMRGFELRRAGASFQQIADKIAVEYKMPKFTRGDAYNDFKALREQTVVQPVEEYRQLEVDRLNTAQIAVWNGVMRGDLPSIETFLKIQAQRAKFEGTFAPTKIAGPDGGPIKFEMVASMTIKALIARVDQINLPPEVRVELLDGLREDFLQIEGTVDTPDTDTG